MRWDKKGLIYEPRKDGSWKDNSALTPTAFEIDESTIRIYAGFRDRKGVSRIGFVDVDSKNPSSVKAVSDIPCLDVGRPGTFDDNGVILGDVVQNGNEIWMYYVGFQIVNAVKFLAYSGLAISNDGGKKFSRYSETPVMDRADEGLYIRAIHSVNKIGENFRIWYATGNGWRKIGDGIYPEYDINYSDSSDGIIFEEKGTKIIECDTSNLEYRIGRPRVYQINGNFIMNFTYGTTDGRYRAGQAISCDGKTWHREDESLGIDLSVKGWDSVHLSYPSIITTMHGSTFMFYNGNNMGADGFGYALMRSN